MSRRIRQLAEARRRTEKVRLPGCRGERPLVGVVYPNVYSVGMANLGLHAVMQQAQRAGVTADRYFLPDPKLIDEHRRTRIPPLGVESGLPLGECEVLLVSVSFEPDFVGLVQLLDLAGIPRRAVDRGQSHPLVVLGGIAATLNPQPAAPFADLVAVGEAEALLPSFFSLISSGYEKEGLIDGARELEGWYAPAAETELEPVVRQHAEQPTVAFPVAISDEAAFSRHVDVEISRGCRWRCRFCAAGYVVAPYRELPLDTLEPALRWAVGQRGRVGLVGTDVSDHKGLEDIVAEVDRLGGQVALPSLRVETLARTDGPMIRVLRKKPPQSLTMAVEAATPDLRCALNKRISDDKLLCAAQNAAAVGVGRLKVYLLVGVPGERWDEVEAAVGLAERLVDQGPNGRLTLSVNGMVPKAGTPFQWEAAPQRSYLRKARTLLRRRLPGKQVNLVFESPDWTRWQCLLSLGGRAVAGHVERAADVGWRRTLALAVDQEPLLNGEGRAEDAPLPWSHILHPTPGEILRQERDNCRDRRYIPPSRLIAKSNKLL